MKRAFIILVFSLTSILALDLTKSRDPNPYTWMTENRDEIVFLLSYPNERLDSLIGKLVFIWITAIDMDSREVAPHIAAALTNHPRTTLKCFHEADTISFNNYLLNLQDLLFTDYALKGEEELKRLRKIRSEMIKAMKETLKEKPPTYEKAMVKKALTTLKKIVVKSGKR